MSNDDDKKLPPSAPTDWPALTKLVNDTAVNWRPFLDRWLDNQRLVAADQLEKEKLTHAVARRQLMLEFCFLLALLIVISAGVWLLIGKERWEIAEKIFYLTLGFFGGRSFLMIKRN